MIVWAVITSLLSGLGVHARAQEPGIEYVAIRCDTKHGVLIIEKHVAANLSGVPRHPGTRTIDQMVGSKALPHDDGRQFPINDLVRSCKLGEARYLVRARARIFGSHVLGRCGAAEPSVELGVSRNGVELLVSLLMVDSCGDTDTSGLDVEELHISEPTQTMQLKATFEDPHGSVRMPFDVTYDFAALDGLTLEKVWKTAPLPAGHSSSAPR
jgi:hypothetical protein